MKRIGIERMLGVALGLAVAAVGMGVAPAGAQDGVGDRITIVVPDLAPRGGASDRFGKRVADELRDLINELHTHQAVSGRDLTRVRRAANVAHEELYDCLKVRQLAMFVNRQQASGQEIRGAEPGQRWGLVLCGEYQQVGDRQVQVDARFVGAENGEEFEVPDFTASERNPDEAAQRILQTFDQWQQQLRHTVFCQQYMDSESWDRALENCERAIEINPSSVSALYKLALIRRELDQPEQALEALEQILEIDPMHEDALKTAGIVATEANRSAEARRYFDRYMELNPGDVSIRLTIANDIYNAGDPVAALEFVQEGADAAADNMTLHTYIGHFAAEAARRAEMAATEQQQDPAAAAEAAALERSDTAPPMVAEVDPARATEYYQTAVDAYRRVYEERGPDTDTAILQRLITSLFKLQQYDEAVELGENLVAMIEDLPEEEVAEAENGDVRVMSRDEKAAIWDAYSRALQEAGQHEEALAAIERAREFGMRSQSLTLRRALLQLRMGQEDQAVAALVEGVQEGELPAEQAFNIVFANAYQDKFQRGQLDAAYRLLEAAGPLAQAEKDRLARNFWRGYIRFEQAKAAHEPMTAQSAARAKPLFEQALQMFQQARGYEQYHPSANVGALIQNAEQFIVIEERLIQRGR